jgi:diguanylate cyclase (GGDEF)-like protein
MEPLSIYQLMLRLALAIAVVGWGWYSAPTQQLVTGCAAGLLLIAAAKPKGRVAACIDVLAASTLQVYSLVWLPLSAWLIVTHRRYARLVAGLLVVAPWLHVWYTNQPAWWWALLSTGIWLYIGVALASPAKREEEVVGGLLPLPDDVREQWEQEREAHRQLRYQYQELVNAHRQLQEQRQIERARQQILQAAVQGTQPPDAARQMLLALREGTGACEGAIWFLDRYSHSLTLAHSTIPNMPQEISLPQPLQIAQESQRQALLKRFLAALPVPNDEVVAALLACEEQVVGAVLLIGYENDGLQSGRQRLQQIQPVLGVAIHAVTQFHSLRRENRLLGALYDIGRLFLNQQSAEDSGKKLVSIVADLLDAPFVTLYLRQAETEKLQIVASVGEAIHLAGPQHETEEGLAGWVAHRAQPLYLPNTSADPKLLGSVSKRVFASLIGAPLQVRARVEGVLLAAHPKPDFFTVYHLETLVSATNQFAQVLEVTRLTRSVGLLAITDGLTGLFNRRYLEMRLDEEIHRALRYPCQFCVMLLDVDHFKHINDTFGHATGDLVLREVAHLVRKHLRETELVFRYGGEEFCAILPETSLSQAKEAAERLRRAIENHPFTTVDGATRLKVTSSIGIAEYPTHGQDKPRLLAAADEALYLAKQQGRNLVQPAARAA